MIENIIYLIIKTMKIKLTKSQIKLLTNFSSIIFDASLNKYYFMPYWFKILENGEIEIYHLNNLPQDIKEKIKERRGNNIPLFPVTENEYKPNN